MSQDAICVITICYIYAGILGGAFVVSACLVTLWNMSKGK
jgi:hypothetical protein